MNLNQISNMIIRILMRKVLNHGVNTGMKTASKAFKKRTPKSDLPPTGARKHPENYAPKPDLPDMDAAAGGKYSGNPTPPKNR